MTNYTFSKGLPVGFGMALMKNESARNAFDQMPTYMQKEIIEGTHNIRSKKEMENYVSAIPLR